VDVEGRTAIAAADPSLWAAGGSIPTEVQLADAVRVGTGWLAVARSGAELLVAPVVLDGGRPRRAEPGDGIFSGIAQALDGSVPGLVGRVIDPGVALGGDERSLGDHTNQLAVVGERAVVKLLSRTSAGPQPGVDLPAHLAAVGFRELPAPIGSVWWRDALVATVSTFVAGASDGWEWYVAAVGAAAAGDTAWRVVDAYADAIGALVARLHVALATPSAVLPSPTGWAGADRVATWRLAAEATLDEALRTTDGPEGERLRSVGPAAREALAELEDVERTPTMRAHGDLHVGQILRTGEGELLVNDFDGNPVGSPGARNEMQAPARDVAWMLASIDHVGRVVARHRPNVAAGAISWIERAREAFLAAYRDGLGERRDLLDERLLGPFSVVQEAHEFIYAARFQRRWRYVPDVALPAALARLGTP
jgi:predicted trehalose synthase